MQHDIHFLTHEFSPFTGGIGIYVEETARACAERGIRAQVWAPGYGRRDLSEFPFAVRRVRMRGKQDWICRWRMGRAFAAEFPGGKPPGTVVLAEPGPIRWWMHAWLTRPPRPDRLIVILHGSELLRLTRLPHRRLLLGQLLDRADRVGVVSTRIRQILLSVFPGLGGKVAVVPGAVRSAWRGDPPAPAASSRSGIIQVGRIHPRKGQLELVRAIGLLTPDLRETHPLRLIGPVSSPAYARQVRAAASSAGIRLDLTGTLPEPDLKQAYQSAALAVMPSQPLRSSIEGLGMALLEAQHFACPVIGTDTGGIPEAMIHQQTGLLVPPRDPSALAAAVQEVLADPRRAAAMGIEGSQFVRKHFSWPANLAALGLT